MPAISELGRRRFLALTLFPLLAACRAPEPPQPTLVAKPAEQPTSTAAPEPTRPPTPVPETATETPRLSPTIRTGSSPTPFLPELTKIPALATTKPTPIEKPTPTPEKRIDETPLSFRQLWEKEVPIAQFVPGDTVFADENQSYLFNYRTGLVCYPNSEEEPKERWRWNRPLPNNQAEFQPASYDSNLIYAIYSGTLQIQSNRLSAVTYIETIDKKKGDSRSRGFPQPQGGNHQFFFHEGVYEYLVLPGGKIETSFQVYGDSVNMLWYSPGRLMHTNKKSNIAVFSTSPWDYVRDIFTANLQTGQERKNVYSPLLGETPVSSRLFEGQSMYAVVDNRLLAIDLRTSGPLWGPGKPDAGQIEEISKHSNGPFLYIHNRISNRKYLSAIEKASGKVVWTKEADNSTIIGDTRNLVLAVNNTQRKLFGFNVLTGEKLETTFAASQLDTLLGHYGDTIVIRGQNYIYGIDSTNGNRRFFYGGFAFYPAVSGRALVFGILGSNKLWVVDLETGKETTHTMKGEIVGVVSPKSRFFLVQTGRPKPMLSAIAV